MSKRAKSSFQSHGATLARIWIKGIPLLLSVGRGKLIAFEILDLYGFFSMVYILSPTEGACLQKIKISRKSCVNVNTLSFCHPSDPSMMLVACAGMGSFELSAWSITKTKSVKLINFSGLPSSKDDLGLQLISLNLAPIRILTPATGEKLEYLLCANEKGIMCWSLEDIEPSRRETRPPLGKLYHPSLPETNQVDGLVQLNEDLLVSKCSNSGILFTWRYRDLLAELHDGQRYPYSSLKDFDKYFTSAIIEPLKIFNWSNTPELYININSNKLTEKFLSGDEKGRIWIYKVKISEFIFY